MTLVVKLGGSLGGTAQLGAWMQVLQAGSQPCVIVPGGGPFADAVRAAQARMGFDDATAHQMALLAMAQFGLVLAGAGGRYVAASSARAMRAALQAGHIPIWLPVPMAANAADIPASWDVTSDSLAAWLAGKIGAEHLLLVKQADVSAQGAARLAREGIVDRAFPGFLARCGGRAWIAGPGDLANAPTLLAADGAPGHRIYLP